MDVTFLWCIIAFICFLTGGRLHSYMVTRVKGEFSDPWRKIDVADSYRKLISDGQAPAWPLSMSYVLMVAGIVIAFGSILFSK